MATMINVHIKGDGVNLWIVAENILSVSNYGAGSVIRMREDGQSISLCETPEQIRDLIRNETALMRNWS